MPISSSRAAWVLMAVAGVLLVIAAFDGPLLRSAAYGAGLAGIGLVVRRLLPDWHAVLLPLSLVLDVAGWTFGVYELFDLYDKILHFTITAMLAVVAGRLLWPDVLGRISRVWAVAIVASVAIALAVTWEVLEWLANLVTEYTMEGLDDTITDLMLGMAGALLGAWLGCRRPRDPSGRAPSM